MLGESERDLLKRAKGGDESAFKEIYERYKSRILNFFFRMCLNEHLAEELLQELFVRIWINLPKFNPKFKFYTYLYRSAHNLWVNEFRRKKEILMAEFDISSSHEQPLDKIIKTEEFERLQKALSSLPEGERAALILSEYNGLSYDEIAEVLEVPLGTVKSRIFRALERLRDKLKGKIEQ